MTIPHSQRVLVLDGSRGIGAAIVGRVVEAGLQMTVTYAMSAARGVGVWRRPLGMHRSDVVIRFATTNLSRLSRKRSASVR